MLLHHEKRKREPEKKKKKKKMCAGYLPEVPGWTPPFCHPAHAVSTVSEGSEPCEWSLGPKRSRRRRS